MVKESEFPIHDVRVQVAISKRVETLVVAIKESESPGAGQVKTAIADRGERTEFDALAQLLNESSSEIRREAAHWIVHQAQESQASSTPGWNVWFLEESSEATLLEHLVDENVSVRLSLLRAYPILKFGDQVEALPFLIENLTHPETEIRFAALQAIQAIGPDLASSAIDTLSELLDDPLPELRDEVYRTLEWLGPDAQPLLRRLLQRILDGEDEPDLRRRAVLALMAQVLEAETLIDEVGQNRIDGLLQALREVGEVGRELRFRLKETTSGPGPDQDYNDLPWLSKAEIAKQIGVSRKTISRWIQDGKLLPRNVRPKGESGKSEEYQVDPADLEMLRRQF